MSWEKVGVVIVSAPVARGSGIYIRVRKQICDAYELYTAKAIEVEIRKVKREKSESV